MTTRSLDGATDVLVNVLDELSNATTLSDVTDLVTGAVRAALGCDGATFVLREDGLCHYVDEDAISPLWAGYRFPVESCLSGWAMIHRQTVVVPDIYSDDRVPHDAYRTTFVRGLVLVPIRGIEPIGALGAYWSRSHEADAEQVRLLGLIAKTAAVALENLELRGALVRRSTERDELARRTDELEAAIHTVAHDLRSPLAAMLGYAELLDDVVAEACAPSTPGGPGEAGEAGTAGEVARVFTHTILDSGRRMAEQIDVMLGLYQITSQPLRPALVDLSQVAHQVADQIGLHTGDRRIEIRIEEGLEVLADPVLAHLMLDNLLGNAVKYTGKKPAAHIELASVEGDPMALTRLGVPHPFRTFVVRDNGDGFASEEAGRLFQPMTRLHTADEFPGTGLGLASVARIVEMHGGQVRAEGEKSVGASFYFSLPTAV